MLAFMIQYKRIEDFEMLVRTYADFDYAAQREPKDYYMSFHCISLLYSKWY